MAHPSCQAPRWRGNVVGTCSGETAARVTDVIVVSLTWCEEAVEISDDGSEGGSVRRLIVHATVNQIGQFGPFRSWQLMSVFIEQVLLQEEQEQSSDR